jgi:hypothetical protein
MLMRIFRAAICALVIPIIFPAYALTSLEVVAKLEAAGYSQIREMKSGKIMTCRAVRAGKEVSLVTDTVRSKTRRRSNLVVNSFSLRLHPQLNQAACRGELHWPASERETAFDRQEI